MPLKSLFRRSGRPSAEHSFFLFIALAFGHGVGSNIYGCTKHHGYWRWLIFTDRLMRLGIGIQGHAKLFEYAYKIPTIRFTPDYLGLQIVHIITILTCAPGVYFHCLIKNSGNGLADIRLTVTLPGSNDRRRKAKTGRSNLIFCQNIPQKAELYDDLTFKKGCNARKSTLHKREGQGPRAKKATDFA